MLEFEQIKALLGNSVTYYLIAVDMNSNYSYLNYHYQEVFAGIHGDLVGKHYALTMHPDDQHTCKIVSQLAFTYPNGIFPATLRKHDGKGGFIITRWEYKAMFDEAGAPAGVFCLGHDITELTQLSGELKEVKDNHSHSIRKHVANLLGLGKIMLEANELTDMQDAAKMMLDTTKELDQVIKIHYK